MIRQKGSNKTAPLLAYLIDHIEKQLVNMPASITRIRIIAIFLANFFIIVSPCSNFIRWEAICTQKNDIFAKKIEKNRAKEVLFKFFYRFQHGFFRWAAGQSARVDAGFDGNCLVNSFVEHGRD